MGMTLRLTGDEVDALHQRAQREGRSVQEVARDALREYLERSTLPDPALDEDLQRHEDAVRRLDE